MATLLENLKRENQEVIDNISDFTDNSFDFLDTIEDVATEQVRNGEYNDLTEAYYIDYQASLYYVLEKCQKLEKFIKSKIDNYKDK